MKVGYWPVAPVQEVCRIADIGRHTSKPGAAFRKVNRARTIGQKQTFGSRYIFGYITMNLPEERISKTINLSRTTNRSIFKLRRSRGNCNHHAKKVRACISKLGGHGQLHAPSVSVTAFFEKLDRGLTGIRLYGIAPPKLATEPERLREIAVQHVSRLRALAPDGLVIYDIQDEPGRNGQARPFPFLPTVEPEVYAYGALAQLAIPKVVYRCVGAHSREVFSGWMDSVRAAGDR